MKVIKADVNDEIIFNTIEDIDTGIVTGITSVLKLPTGNLNNILIDFNFINKKLPEELRIIANFNINDKKCIDVELRKIIVDNKVFENACYIPSEVFEEPCYFMLGLYGFALEGEDEIKQRISLIPLKNIVVKGSYDPDATEGIVPTPTVFEVYFNDVAKANEQMQKNLEEYEKILSEKVQFYKKYESLYISNTNNQIIIPIGIEEYQKYDVLFLDIEGMTLVENIDFTVNADTKEIILAEGVDAGTKIHIVDLKTTVAEANDYEFLKGEKGDTGEKGEDGTVAEKPKAFFNAEIQDNATLQQCGALPLKSLNKIRGKDIEQETREGYNSNSMPDNSGGTVSGVQYSISKSVLKLNGTCTGGSQIPTSRFKIGTFPAGTYSLMFFKNKGSMTPMGTGLYINDALTGGNRVASKYLYDYENITEITLEAETTLYGYIWQDTNSVYTDLELGIMVASGTYTSKPKWEQYGSMPSLAFPSPVKHVGGSVKSYNLYNIGDVEETTVKGVTYSIKNGRFKANGTSTGEISIKTNSVLFNLLSGDYTFGTKVISGTYSGIVGKYVYNGSGENIIDGGLINSTVNRTLTGNATDLYAQIYIANGVVFNNYEADIMLVKGTYTKETLPPYLPYGEVGSVYDIAKVNKNICSGIESGNINSSGVNYDDTTSIRSKNYDLVQPNTSYIASKNGVVSGFNVSEYDSNKTFIKRTYYSNGLFTTSTTTKYVKVQTSGSITDVIQVEKGNVITDYIAHQQENHSLDLTNLPLYGKNDRIYEKDGKWYVHNERNQKIIKGPDLENLPFLQVEERTNIVKYNISDILTNGALVDRDKIITNMFISIYGNDESIEHIRNGSSGYPNNIVLYVLKDNLSSYDVVGLQELLNNKPLQIVYEITPTETEITDKKVIAQLNAFEKARMCEGITNISINGEYNDLVPTIDLDYWTWYKGQEGPVTVDTAPVGVGYDYFGTVAPENYMFADGSAISRTEYKELFEIIGEVYGKGDGSTTFNLPDKRTRVSAMYSNGDSIFGELGATLGEAETTLTVYNLPSHSHTFTGEASTHSHTATTVSRTDSGSSMSDGSTRYDFTASTSTGSATITPKGTISSTGSGKAFSNLQPTLICNYIIKVK